MYYHPFRILVAGRTVLVGSLLEIRVMAVPKYKTSQSKRDMRRSHHALKPRLGSSCPNCGEVKHAHSVCEACGHYRGKQVIEPRRASLGVEDTFDTES